MSIVSTHNDYMVNDYIYYSVTEYRTAERKWSLFPNQMFFN